MDKIVNQEFDKQWIEPDLQFIYVQSANRKLHELGDYNSNDFILNFQVSLLFYNVLFPKSDIIACLGLKHV